MEEREYDLPEIRLKIMELEQRIERLESAKKKSSAVRVSGASQQAQEFYKKQRERGE